MQPRDVRLRRRPISGTIAFIGLCVLLALFVYVKQLPPSTKWALSSMYRVSSDVNQSAIQLTKDSYMIYSVYWDRRPQNSTPELMVLGVSRCRNKTVDLLPYAIFKDTDGQMSSILQFTFMEMDTDKCPDPYVPDCIYVPTQLFQPVSKGWAEKLRANNVDQNLEVTLYGGEKRAVRLRPIWSAEKYEDSLSVCVPALYWYHDWRRILIFVAMWRAQGAAHFYFYFNSGTKEVYRLLKYYEQQGYATVMPYPDLPSNEAFDPNYQTFRLAHALAINDCALRTKSKWAAHVDVDEFILMNDTNVRLIDWVLKQPNDVAELSFTHRQLIFADRLMSKLHQADAKFDRRDTGSALVFPSGRSPKVIFQSRGIRSDSTHWVARMQKGFRKQGIDTAVAYYGHFRWDFDRKGAGNHTIQTIMRADLAEQAAKHIELTRAAVFGSGLPKYNGSAIDRTTLVCSENWGSQKTKCMVPMRSCTEKMMPLADWHFDRSTDRTYTLL